jgi:lipopolysaccharide biosynthesis glycosyltransferase
MILHGRGLIPTDGRILHKAHTEPNPPPYYYWNNNSFDYQHFYHSGSMMIGYKDAWVAFHADFLITVDGFVERDMFIGEDQNVLQSVCLRVPKRCIYLTLKGVKDNPYFGLRYVLHHGGSRRMYGWWYPPEGTPPDSVVVQAKSDGTKERGTPGIPSSRMEPETSRVRQGIEGGTKVVSVMENHTAIPQNPCINQDFVPTSKRAIFTLLMPKKEEYVVAASVLSASIQKHVNETDTVILELVEHPLSRHEWAKLQRAGWTHKCTVPLVKPTFKPSGKFAEQFSKLHVWGMTTYDVALYMDSDTIVLGGLDELFDMKFEAPYKIGVTNDYRFDKNGWVDSFNMGVFVIHPSRDEYERLINLQQQGAVREYEQVMAEQGWLNVVYKDQWKDIGIKFNANIAALRDSKFKAARDDFRIVHFTLYKPWFGGKRLGSIIQEWNDLRNNTVSKYGCINKDFVKPSTHKLALVTFLTDMRMMNSKLMMEDHSDYTYGAAVLLKSIQEHVKKREMDLILLEIPSRPLTDNDRTYLKGLGWNICTVTPIDAKHRPFGRFVDQFNKFHLWSFVEYDKVLYLDSDALVVGNIDSLLDMTLESNQRIGVTQDFFGTRFVDKFNMGVFLIHPNITEFRLLLNLQEHDLVKYDHPQAEQGFLNVLYKDQWKEIGIKFNGNMAVWCQKRSAWPKDPRILHFTLEKGWSYPPPKHRVKSEEPYEVFLDIWKKAARDYGVWPKDNASSQVLEPK